MPRTSPWLVVAGLGGAVLTVVILALLLEFGEAGAWVLALLFLLPLLAVGVVAGIGAIVGRLVFLGIRTAYLLRRGGSTRRAVSIAGSCAGAVAGGVVALVVAVQFLPVEPGTEAVAFWWALVAPVLAITVAAAVLSPNELLY